MFQVVTQRQKEAELGVSKRGRGRPRGNATQVNIAIPQPLLDALDAWTATLKRDVGRPDQDIGRPEAIRRLIALKCVVRGPRTGRRR